jgi:hypothetical protein
MRTRLALAVLAVTATPVLAQSPGTVPSAVGTETGRFVMRDYPDGVLRMDTRTGAISYCTRADGGVTCRLAADDRTALAQEIDRLRAENEALRRGTAQAARPAQPGGEGMTLPSDAEVDRALSLAERIWRRLRGMIRESEDNPLPERRL